jgi:MinD superfamily P-loop ATPase
MGPKLVDAKLCTKCGECALCCPYKAIKLAPLPLFNEKQCRGCWACYNLCPEKAIYTAWLRGKGHYPGPSEEFKNKMSR